MASAPQLNAPNSPSGSSMSSFEEGFGTLPPNTVAITIGPSKRKNSRKNNMRKASRKNNMRKASRKNNMRKASRRN